MHKTTIWTLAALFLTPVSPALCGQAAGASASGVVVPPTKLSPDSDASITTRPAAKPVLAQKIILVGDSSAQVGSGWGGAFCAYHVTAAVACVNLARGGRSTYSYRAEGSWDIALREMKSGGYQHVYVLIQFGGNDQPGKPGRSTNLSTEFPANLTRFVQEARAAGAVPVLATPITRREFKAGVLQDDLEPWAAATRKVAAETGTPLVDFHADTVKAVVAMGVVESLSLAIVPPPPAVVAAAEHGTTIRAESAGDTSAPPADRNAAEPVGEVRAVFDYSHLGRKGADLFSAILTRELAKAVPDLRHALVK